jgi:hypothetical protein
VARSLGGTLGRSSILPDGLPGRDPLGDRQTAVARRRGTGDGCSGLRGRTGKGDTDEAKKCDHRNTKNQTKHDHRPFWEEKSPTIPAARPPAAVAERHALVDHGPPVFRVAAVAKSCGRGWAGAAPFKPSIAAVVPHAALAGLDLRDALGRRGVTHHSALTVGARLGGVDHVLADGGAANENREKRKKSHRFFLSE